jgi:hypothetical protein
MKDSLGLKILGIANMGIEIQIGFVASRYAVRLTQPSPNGGPDYSGYADNEALSAALKDAYNQLRTERYGDAED